MINYSIIISTQNKSTSLNRLLNSLATVFREENNSQFEVIIIDNASVDYTAEAAALFIKDNPDLLIRYFFEKSIGLHNARHRGALEAKGHILCYLDDDVTLSPNWFASVKKTFETTDAVLVGGKILPIYEVLPPDWIDQFWNKNKEGKWLGYLSLIDLGEELKKIDQTYVFGCNFSINKDFLFKCGGFHPDMFPFDLIKYRGDGETGLAFRIKKAGGKAYYNPGAIVYHHIPKERLTLEYFCERAFRQGISNSFTELRMAGGIKNMEGFVINNAYREGMVFHRKAVAKDTDLQEWIIKENYILNDKNWLDHQLEVFKNSDIKERQSFYKKTQNPQLIKEKLIQLNIEVADYKINISDFDDYMKKFPKMVKNYEKTGDVQIEKLLEHYLTFSFLNLQENDVYIDVAAAGSPWTNVLSEKTGIDGYRLDLSYPSGIHDGNIGANATDTELPDDFADALTLHCAYECFQGDGDWQFIVEAERILKKNGKCMIIPLYFENDHIIISSPFCNQADIPYDDGAKRVWRDDVYKAPFSRHYSPESFYERIYKRLNKCKGKFIYISNLNDLIEKYQGQRIYCNFMFIMEKTI